jgi:hypothetical protein
MLRQGAFAARALCAAVPRYRVEGGTDLAIDGTGTPNLKPGDGFRVPAGARRGGKDGPAKTVIVSAYGIEKGNPLASPA